MERVVHDSVNSCCCYSRDKLTSVGAMDSEGKFKSKELRTVEEEFKKIDSAARMGIKFA